MKKLYRPLAALAALVLLAAGCAGLAAPTAQSGPAGDFTEVPADLPRPAPESAPQEEYRAMWVSYLEWEALGAASEETFRQSVADMMQSCADLGLNTVVAHVRPFGDALYQSKIFPASHLLGGAQGQSPGYDPLAVMLEEAHARGLRLEAWINPYRVRLNAGKPPELSPDNPAVLHPEWVREAGGGLYYDPGLPEVRRLVADGVAEILENYPVDGIHFDDYFYPTTEPEFDADTYAAYGGGKPLAEWRRENVNELVRLVYATVKEKAPKAQFGISPQGNNANNYDMQYSDVGLWLREEGYVDYVMPQLYWGFGYLTASGRDSYQFARLCEEWNAMPRAEGVRLYIGLGAWRIGDGDGGANDQAEWSSGRNLADMVAALRGAGCTGFALYRYDSLYRSAWPELAAAECEALRGVMSEK